MSRRLVELSLIAFSLMFLVAFSVSAQEEPLTTDDEAGETPEDSNATDEEDAAAPSSAPADDEAIASPTTTPASTEGDTEGEDAAEPTAAPEEAVTPTEQPTPVEASTEPTAEAESDEATTGHEHAEETNCHGRCFFEGLNETDHPFALHRGRVNIGLIGTIQLLAVPFIQNPMASIESGSVANAEGFRLRRARFGFAGSLPHEFDVRLLFELGQQGANILDASVAWEPHPLARITAGALKVPFSGIMMQSAEYQSFLQRPYAVRTIAPDRALGVEVSGQHRYFSYNAGVFNGGGDYYRGDNNAGMLYAARLAAHILGPPPTGELTQTDNFVFQVAGSYFFNQDATGNRHAVSAELLLLWRRLSLRGEFLWDTFDPSGDPETDDGVEYGSTERRGWFVDAGVFIINDHLQVALRYEAQQIIEAAFDFNDTHDLWTISGAINGYFLQGRIKLSLQYEHRHEWSDPQFNNDFLALQLQGRI